MTTIVLPLVLLASVLAASPASAHAAQHPMLAHWYLCRLTLHDLTVSRQCHTYAMPRATHHPVGWWIARTRIHRDVLVSVRYPRFHRPRPPVHAVRPTFQRAIRPAPVQPVQPASFASGYCPAGTYKVTYYLATGSPMANGQYPYVGAVANN